MRDGAQLKVRPQRLRIDRLVEPERDDDAAVVLAAFAIPVRPQQLNRRRDEREVIRLTERFSADRLRFRINRNVVLRRKRQRRFRIGRKDQCRRPRPAERAVDRRLDMEPGHRQNLRNSADNDHRLAEHDPDLIRLGDVRHLAYRPGFDDRQLVRRLRRQRCHKKKNPRTNSLHAAEVSMRASTAL